MRCCGSTAGLRRIGDLVWNYDRDTDRHTRSLTQLSDDGYSTMQLGHHRGCARSGWTAMCATRSGGRLGTEEKTWHTCDETSLFPAEPLTPAVMPHRYLLPSMLSIRLSRWTRSVMSALVAFCSVAFSVSRSCPLGSRLPCST